MLAIFNKILFLLLIFISSSKYQAAPYAQWAHSHVVWLNGVSQNQQKIRKLVQDYKNHNIPVGGVNIDSDWSTCFNNFKVNRSKFPNMQKLVSDFHQMGIKIILWATPIINKDCQQYQVGLSKGYFLNHGKTAKWWHGNGAFVDFFNPEAKKWFTGLMDRVLEMGFDGWKCDGADPLIILLRPWPYSGAKKRYIAYQQYAHQYYGTFYNHTKSRNPNALIMSRPVDSFNKTLFLSYSPKYVMFAGWVGDQHNDVDGFKQAMTNVIHSASRNYLNFGFDIGGYKTRGQSKKWLYLRWVQAGSLVPFMQNGGNGPHEPWLFDQETVDIYRKYVKLHYDLKQFFLTSGSQAYAKKKSVIQPLKINKNTVVLGEMQDFSYVLWNTFLVSPIFEESGFVQVDFPEGYYWVYYFNHSLIYKGGKKISMGLKLQQTALFMRSNSVIALNNEIWLLYLEQGEYNKTIISDVYSEEVDIKYRDNKLQLKIDRYYADNRNELETKKVRIIGVIKIIDEQSDEKLSKIQKIETQINEYEINIIVGQFYTYFIQIKNIQDNFNNKNQNIN